MKGFGCFALMCGGLILAACGSTPVTPDRTSTPDALVTTVAALQTQNAHLATQVAGLSATLAKSPTATPLPSPTPSTPPTETLAPTPTPIPTHIATQRPVPTATSPGPQILSFTVEPAEAKPAETVTLRWTAINTAQVVIQERGLPGLYGPVTYYELHVAPGGYWVPSISDPGWSQSVFRLEMSDLAGSSVWQEVTVNVQCLDSFVFSQQRRADCPSGPAIPSAAAEEIFETGRMIWLATSRMIYELRDGGGLTIYQDTWTDDQPAIDPSIVPPDGRYQPLRGFGKVWRTVPDSRNMLGWALAPERGYQTQLQNSKVGCRTIPESGFYLQTSDGRVLHICDGDNLPGYWEDVTP